tara:strand:+ start:709 stop:1611 length:903 start_codon:yes stop_codon:yes gene_type:complete
MPRNPYISLGTNSEQKLQENLIIEALKIYGHEVYYLPRGIVNRDTILNEVITSKFGDAFKIEMYVASTDGFEGDGQFLSKFGLEVRNQIKLVASRTRWDDLVGRFKVTEEVRPAEGDLIYFPLVNGLFEIKYVAGDSPFYQLGNLPTYELTCETFEYSNENLETGIRAIDEIEEIEAFPYLLTLGSGSGTFRIGEEVTQVLDSDTTIRGEIAKLSNSIAHVIHSRDSDNGSDTFWQVTAGSYGNLIGTISGASYLITSTDGTSGVTEVDTRAQNDVFTSIGDGFVDFSETNPFGDINYIQ